MVHRRLGGVLFCFLIGVCLSSFLPVSDACLKGVQTPIAAVSAMLGAGAGWRVAYRRPQHDCD